MPGLLDEAHWLHENRGVRFALCGFIVNDMEAAIEVKAARKITSDHLKGLRHLRQDHPEVGRLVLVCLEEQAWRSDDGISTCCRCGIS